MSGMEPAVIAAMAPELLATSAAAAAPEVALAALPAAGMTATGGLLGTGAGAFAGADALAGLGLGAEGLGGGMGAAMSAGLPASAAPFTATTMPSMIGSFGLGDATAYGMAQPLTMGDKLGMFANRMMPSKEAMMMNGMKMAGQGLLGGQQQQMPHAMPSMQTGGDYRSLVPQSGGDYRKRRDELLKRMLGMQ